MNTLRILPHHRLLAWMLATTILILAGIVALIWANYPAETASQVQTPASLPVNHAAQPTPPQLDSQGLPEGGYIRAHAIDQNLVGSGPVGQRRMPVLTPACDQLAECSYIRAHIQAEEASLP